MAPTTARPAAPVDAPPVGARPPQTVSAPWWRGPAAGAVVLALAFALLVLAYLLARPLALLLAAVVVAQALAPLVDRLERRLPRGAAVALVYVVLVVGAALAGWLAVPTLVRQGQQLVIAAPGLIGRGRAWFAEVDPVGADRVVAAVQAAVDRFTGALVGLPLAVVSSTLEIVLVLFMSAYWLAAAPALRRFVLGLVPPDRQGRSDGVLTAVGETMGGYVRATLANAVIVGALVYGGLLVIGVDYPLVLALIAAAGELVPVVGPILASVPALAIALTESPRHAAFVLAFYLVMQQLESNLLLPAMMRRQADIPPLVSLFALLAGSAVGGLLGALVAIPLAGALRVVVVRVLAPAQRSWAGSPGDAPDAPNDQSGTPDDGLGNRGDPPDGSAAAERGADGRTTPGSVPAAG